jgi:HAD superfamily hydrolase (TIGR01509 family)
MIKCIIFDCDGTQVDSEYLCNLGLEIKLKEYGITESAKSMMIQYRGGKLAEIIKSIEIKHNLNLNEDFVISYRLIVEKFFENNLKPVEGIIDTLEKLELPICVAFSGPLKKIENSLSITNLKHYFQNNIFSSYEVNSWKPDPGLFLHAAKEMGFSPKECAVVEDSEVGINAAKSANMYPIYYNSLNNKNDNVCIIKHMSELLSNVI